MTNVIEFEGVTTLDIPPERILKGARDANLADVVIIGYDDDGQFYFASSTAKGPEVLWLMELAKTRLIEIAEDYCDE